MEEVWLPYALSLGVDYILFWTLNPNKLKAFEKAFEFKQDIENNNAWIQGIYIQRAIASSLSKDIKYFETPIDFDSEKTEQKRKSTMVRKFESMVVKINKQFEGSGKN